MDHHRNVSNYCSSGDLSSASHPKGSVELQEDVMLLLGKPEGRKALKDFVKKTETAKQDVRKRGKTHIFTSGIKYRRPSPVTCL